MIKGLSRIGGVATTVHECVRCQATSIIGCLPHFPQIPTKVHASKSESYLTSVDAVTENQQVQPIVLISTFPRRLNYRTVIQVADLAEVKAFGYTFLPIHNEAWSCSIHQVDRVPFERNHLCHIDK